MATPWGFKSLRPHSYLPGGRPPVPPDVGAARPDRKNRDLIRPGRANEKPEATLVSPDVGAAGPGRISRGRIGPVRANGEPEATLVPPDVGAAGPGRISRGRIGAVRANGEPEATLVPPDVGAAGPDRKDRGRIGPPARTLTPAVREARRAGRPASSEPDASSGRQERARARAWHTGARAPTARFILVSVRGVPRGPTAGRCRAVKRFAAAGNHTPYTRYIPRRANCRTRTAGMIAKTLFLTKDFYRIGVQSLREKQTLRDHGPVTGPTCPASGLRRAAPAGQAMAGAQGAGRTGGRADAGPAAVSANLGVPGRGQHHMRAGTN